MVYFKNKFYNHIKIFSSANIILGYGATAVVMSATYIPTGEKVAIKRIDLEKCGADIDEMRVNFYYYFFICTCTQI